MATCALLAIIKFPLYAMCLIWKYIPFLTGEICKILNLIIIFFNIWLLETELWQHLPNKYKKYNKGLSESVKFGLLSIS